MQRVCVFCGSSTGARSEFAGSARGLGQCLAARGLGLVYGAGHIGLMGILADAVLQAGGTVAGIIPQALVDRELAHTGLTELHVVDTMHQRKALMADLAEAFVALPGGYGTADELFEILTWGQLGIHQKPIGLLNIAGFFDPLITWIDRCVSEGFIQEKHRKLLEISTDIESLLDAIFRPHSIPEILKGASPADR